MGISWPRIWTYMGQDIKNTWPRMKVRPGPGGPENILKPLIIDTPYPRGVDNYGFMYTNIAKNIRKTKKIIRTPPPGPGPGPGLQVVVVRVCFFLHVPSVFSIFLYIQS